MKLIIFLLLIQSSVFGQSFVLEDFVQELSSRQSRVEEFQYIKKIASKLGIKHVYMFGGTAAAWGHYVRWDMRREQNIEKLQAERFDYDYMNVFRANQDFDVVIDGTVEQAEALEKIVQKHFNYFSGTRPTWEVRLLNEQRADKDAIMGADFQNQHTDSHSTGLIEMMDCVGFDCVKDVRDITNPRSAFLMDMYEAKLHYYYSKLHKSTKRFKLGMNPEILSIIRYFTKAVQYELERRPEDIELLQKMINEFDPSQSSLWDPYVGRWLEKNAKKLIVNAVDMEFAQRIIEKTGLKNKLVRLGSSDQINSMSWWLSKEALISKPVGLGNGELASELFDTNEEGKIIVAHETDSFAAYESIMKAHDGGPNVLISRDDVNGEAAVFGDGHYTKIGREGARGTGLTIRYILNPMARDGHDFIFHNNFIIVRNRNALTVIYEELNLNAVDYFDNLISGLEFDHSDRGVAEKLKRRMKRKLSHIDDKDRELIYQKVKAHLSSPEAKHAVMEAWYSMEWSYLYPDTLDYLPYIGKNVTAFIEDAREVYEYSRIIDKNILSNPKWYSVAGFKSRFKNYLRKNHPLQLGDIEKLEVLKKLDWNLVDIFGSFTYSNFELSDEGLRESRAKLLNSRSQNLSRAEKDQIAKLALESAEKVAPQSSWGMIKAELWYELDFHHEYPEVDKMYQKTLGYGGYYFQASSIDDEHWTDSRVEKYLNSPNRADVYYLVTKILSKDKFRNHSKINQWIERIMSLDDRRSTKMRLFQDYFSYDLKKYTKHIRKLSKDRDNAGTLMTSIGKSNSWYWMNKPDILWNIWLGKRRDSYNESINEGWHWKVWMPILGTYAVARLPVWLAYKAGKAIAKECAAHYKKVEP